ncbi:HAD hydrolase-like protein [Ramlibacter sp. AN1015]|uniref:HAD hydrolase-like protein n=1 Tax=Ramlibacter sp. AN1015 TaxID=3133428 RepID=UPI0030C562F6
MKTSDAGIDTRGNAGSSIPAGTAAGSTACCSRYPLVIFDFDGTLADTYPVFVAALEEVVAGQRLRPIDRVELERMRGGHGRALMQRLGVRWWQVPRVGAAMLHAMTQRRAQMRLFPGVAQALESLARGGSTVAVVTSNSEDNVRAVLGPSAGHVSVFECGAAVFGKAARFRRVLRRTGVSAREAIAVGDELRDHEAARRCGIGFAAVAWGYTAPQALRNAGPECFIECPEALALLAARADAAG